MWNVKRLLTLILNRLPQLLYDLTSHRLIIHARPKSPVIQEVTSYDHQWT